MIQWYQRIINFLFLLVPWLWPWPSSPPNSKTCKITSPENRPGPGPPNKCMLSSKQPIFRGEGFYRNQTPFCCFFRAQKRCGKSDPNFFLWRKNLARDSEPVCRLTRMNWSGSQETWSEQNKPRWWFQICFIFTPTLLGEIIQFD